MHVVWGQTHFCQRKMHLQHALSQGHFHPLALHLGVVSSLMTRPRQGPKAPNQLSQGAQAQRHSGVSGQSSSNGCFLVLGHDQVTDPKGSGVHSQLELH